MCSWMQLLKVVEDRCLSSDSGNPLTAEREYCYSISVYFLFPYTSSLKQPLLGTVPIDSQSACKSFIAPGQCLTVYLSQVREIWTSQKLLKYLAQDCIDCLQHILHYHKTAFLILSSSKLSRSWTPALQGVEGILYFPLLRALFQLSTGSATQCQDITKMDLGSEKQRQRLKLSSLSCSQTQHQSST